MQIIKTNQSDAAGVTPQTPPPAPITGAAITHPIVAAPIGVTQQPGVAQQPQTAGQIPVAQTITPIGAPIVAPQAAASAAAIPGSSVAVAPIPVATTDTIGMPGIEASLGQGSGFDTIPTRIQDLAPLVVEEEDPAVRTQVLETLGDLGQQLASVHRMAAEAFMSQGCYDQAEPHLNAAATFAADDPEYHNQLGFVQFLNDNMAGAIISFERVVALDPQQVDALFNLGMVLFAQEDFTRAEDCFRRVLERAPGEAEAWNNRGACCFHANRIEDAKACFARALELDPSNEDARMNLSSL